MRSEFYYQSLLIFLGIIASIFFAVFVYREIYPEYKIFQNDYIALEEFRSTYTGEAPPDFQVGVKQILIEKEDKGPPIIDRCISCHVALQFPHFSPTKIEKDINGNVVFDAEGIPVKVPNADYLWAKLDQKIAELSDAKVNEQLKQQGETAKVRERIAEAEKLKSLKTADVGDVAYDVTKVLAMHPLIGRETRPFEFHPIDEYGCVACHNGNGRGLTTEKAHGPVFDGQYETEFIGVQPQFTEADPKNDPRFAKIFNDKPSDELLFQTTPILVGALIQGKCMQCHQSSQATLENAITSANITTQRRTERSDAINVALANEKQALLALLELRESLKSKGYTSTLEQLNGTAKNYALPPEQITYAAAQAKFLMNHAGVKEGEKLPPDIEKEVAARLIAQIDQQIEAMLGSSKLAQELVLAVKSKDKEKMEAVDNFLEAHQKDPLATGTIFTKMAAIDLDKEILTHVQNTEKSFEKTVTNQNVISAIASDIDFLTKNFHHGQELYISQACYACHRIAGYARGGVGPELTREGKAYPWFVKQSLVWPQADVKTSTMPNYHLDHEELEDLLTYLFGQVGENKSISDIAQKIKIQQWESGAKMAWEKPIPPSKIHDLRYSMTVFATEGCAACHRLKGFESDVGYRVEKEGKNDFDDLYREKEWFTKLFPEDVLGSQIVEVLGKHANEIDEHIVDHVRQGSILEEIDKNFPDTIEAYYSPFKYAKRAKNHHFKELADKEKDPKKKAEMLAEVDKWQKRVHRVLMMFIQEYGLGRLIGPRPNWSGVYHTDQWLMEHFHNPAAHTARSIMPSMPFDDSKFYALTYMLDILGRHNRDAVRSIWEHRGFNPEQAFEIHCVQCHGESRQGNGPVSEWIYPVPKNLRNADFMRNLTKERVIASITHGVKGTPMPPWGEAPMDKPKADGIPELTKEEIQLIANWLFSTLPGSQVIKSSEEVPKWRYSPEDAIKELHREGNELKPGQEAEPSDLQKLLGYADISNGKDYYAAMEPAASKDGEEVSQYFDVGPKMAENPDRHSYYIKKKFYTENNIEVGKEFFELNCAVCHGADADGAGIRAEAMHDAKPRMLTNLDWLNTRDDLRLLRSIKYGVPGTAMIPWGDATSMQQRMQLVIFIRSLSEEEEVKSKLSSAIYKAFDTASLLIEKARVEEYPGLEKREKEVASLQDQQESFYRQVQIGQSSSQVALEAYQKQLDLLSQVKQLKERDQLLVELRKLVDAERNLFQTMGMTLINQHMEIELINKFIYLIESDEERFKETDGKLSLQMQADKEKEREKVFSEIIAFLDAKIADLKKEKTIEEGKMPSAEQKEHLNNLGKEIDSYIKIKDELISIIEQAKRLQKKQNDLFNQFNNMLKETGQTPQGIGH